MITRRPLSHDSKRCAVISAESCHVLAAAGWRVCLILVFFNNDHNDNDGEDKVITNIIMSAVVLHADSVPASTRAASIGEVTGQ